MTSAQVAKQPEPSPTAAAEVPRTPEQIAVADRLFDEGRALARDQRYEEGCRLFVQSDAIKRTFGTAANLGDCAEREGRAAWAWSLFTAAAQIADGDGAPALAKFARGRAAALTPGLSTVIATIPTPVPRGTIVHIGGRVLPGAPEIRLFVDPGDVEITIELPDRPITHTTLHADAGATVRFAVASAASTPTSSQSRLMPTAPGFTVIDRIDSISSAGVNMTYLSPIPLPYYDSSSDVADRGTRARLRFETFARYIHKASGFGGYFQIAYVHEPLRLKTNALQRETLEDAELGGIFAKPGPDGITFIIHVGMTLPTATADETSALALRYNSLTALPQTYNSLPYGITAKLGTSVFIQHNMLFGRLDLGIDYNIYSYQSTIGPGLHYNAGVGVDFGLVVATLESENLTIIYKPDIRSTPLDYIGTIGNLAAAIRMRLAHVSPYVAGVIPYDHSRVSFAFTAGADIPIPW